LVETKYTKRFFFAGTSLLELVELFEAMAELELPAQYCPHYAYREEGLTTAYEKQIVSCKASNVGRRKSDTYVLC